MMSHLSDLQQLFFLALVFPGCAATTRARTISSFSSEMNVAPSIYSSSFIHFHQFSSILIHFHQFLSISSSFIHVRPFYPLSSMCCENQSQNNFLFFLSQRLFSYFNIASTIMCVIPCTNHLLLMRLLITKITTSEMHVALSIFSSTFINFNSL